jgi:hypothetical protein
VVWLHQEPNSRIIKTIFLVFFTDYVEQNKSKRVVLPTRSFKETENNPMKI